MATVRLELRLQPGLPVARHPRDDPGACLVWPALSDHLHPFAGFEILAVLAEMLDLLCRPRRAARGKLETLGIVRQAQQMHENHTSFLTTATGVASMGLFLGLATVLIR
ncbi:MAG TPA: hypothetical protein VGQ19_12385 [Burkholderiales bacterium]|jgi:hypothetical protein|nr:hypothetical protein [Burkholderiales bacterium]